MNRHARELTCRADVHEYSIRFATVLVMVAMCWVVAKGWASRMSMVRVRVCVRKSERVCVRARVCVCVY